MNLYIPENKFGILKGYYSNDMLANLLRENSHKPNIIYYIADMIEDGNETEKNYNKKRSLNE